MDGLGILSVIGLFGSYALADAPATRIDEWGLDRMSPIHADRQIRTVDLQWRAREKAWAGGRASLRLGATLSRPTGRIATSATPALDSPAWGLGPAVDLRLTLLRRSAWHAALDGGAAVLLYDRPFPAGGGHYNGMFRLGPSIGAALPAGGRVELGWAWMHVSNGQGLGPHNPSYEARGWSLRWQLPL